MKETEEWRNIVIDGIVTNYMVSNLGKVFNTKTKKELKGTSTRNEYVSVQLSINKKPKTLMVHRLVAEAFCPNAKLYSIVDHIDRNKHNNKASNLRWVSQEENSINVANNKKQKQKNLYVDDLSGFKIVPESGGKYMASKEGIIVNANTKRILVGQNRNGYIRGEINRTIRSFHRVIWETFNGTIPEDLVVDHIDGNRSNNRLDNLRVVSQSENMNNSYNNGHHSAKSVLQYSKSGELLKRYDSLAQASQTMRCTPHAISSAIEREGSCKGFLWDWENNASVEKIKNIAEKNSTDSHCTSITAYNLDGSIYRHFSSIKEACETVGCNCSTIIRGYQNKRKAKGYYWVPDSANFTINDILKNNK